MTFQLTEEQELLRTSARRFLQARAPVAAFRALRDSQDAAGFSRELWGEVASMGWAGLLVPEEFGGVGFGYVGAGLVAEETGRTLTASPLLSTAVLGATALLQGGTPEQQAAHLPAIAGGERLFALAVDERARHAPGHIETRARRADAGFRLSGEKVFVLDGHVADVLAICARLDDGIALFLVERRARGVTVERTDMVDSRNAATVRLQDVEVSRGAVLGARDGAVLLERTLDGGRAVLAAELVGLASECLERTLDYLRQREQFGRKLAEFQALQHRAAHLFCEIELARSAASAALHALDQDAADTALLVSVAKAKSGEVARLATNEALQMHGGIGMTDEFDIGLFMKRARVAGETFGDYAFHADRVARHYRF